MVGGTSFHRGIQAKRALVAMSKSNGNGNSKNKSKSKSFLISKKQNHETQRRTTVSLTSDTLRVS